MTNEREAQLNQIAEEVENLKALPLYTYRVENEYTAVIGEGDVHADIMFVGEAPGKREAEQGRPFVGNAGKILDELLATAGIRRADVYITNIVKDRPPKNRDPRAAEIELYAPFLERQIDIIQPKVIATLGRFAMAFMLKQFDAAGQGQKIGELHGRTITVQASYGEIAIVPLYHPAATFYNRGLKDTLQEDFKVLQKFVA